MRDFFSLAKIIAAPGDPSILDMCLQKADKGKGAAEVGVKNNRQSSGFWKLKQKKRMRLNKGSECHLVGEEVAQGGASTSQPASLHLCAEELPDHTNANTTLTQIYTLLVYTSNDPSFFSHNIFALRQTHHLPGKGWCCSAVHCMYWLYSIQPPFCDLRQVKVPSMNSLPGEILEQKIQIFLVRRRRGGNGRWIQEWILASYASPASILAIPPLSSPMLKYFS